MKAYLRCFFEEYSYEATDAETLLRAYETIVADATAEALFSEALSAYESDFRIDYKKEILGRAEKIASVTQINHYTVVLLLFISLTKHLKELYLLRGLSMQIYRDSVLDLKWKLEECKAVRGICGSFVGDWFPGFFSLDRFALGRLQFEIRTMSYDYEKDGVKLEKGVSRVINVHIPRTGTPLDKESCDAAYAAARAFFADVVGENAPFICHSWLLFPENKVLFPARTNVYRFLSEYDVIDWEFNDGEDLWRLFDTYELNPDRLPTNGALRRAYAEHLKSGGRVGCGFGVKIN